MTIRAFVAEILSKQFWRLFNPSFSMYSASKTFKDGKLLNDGGICFKLDLKMVMIISDTDVTLL